MKKTKKMRVSGGQAGGQAWARGALQTKAFAISKAVIAARAWRCGSGYG
ncbi:MAG: hypothetical protein KBB43_05230 [Brachymonas sp.]|jgi:hypothetical protein|nr:hypothetical protein [Brachymonas sp.]